MSRPIIDPEWESLLARFRSGNVLKVDSLTNVGMVEEWHKSGRAPHGCSLPPKANPAGPHWLCKFFLAGAQRTIARGTLQQCAVLYDAALIFFADYRTQSKRPEFNFGRDFGFTVSKSLGVNGYFSSMVALLNRRNEFLRTGEQKLQDRRLKIAQRQHDTRTAAGRIEKRLGEIESKLVLVDSLAASINRVELLLATIVHTSHITMAAPDDSQNFAKQILTGNP